MATVKQYTPTPAVEFKNGLTRASMGSKYGGPAGTSGLLGRLNNASTLYRQAAPTHGNLNGSPGIPETGLKDYLFKILKKPPISLLKGSDLTFLNIIIGLKVKLLLIGKSKPPPTYE